MAFREHVTPRPFAKPLLNSAVIEKVVNGLISQILKAQLLKTMVVKNLPQNRSGDFEITCATIRSFEDTQYSTAALIAYASLSNSITLMAYRNNGSSKDQEPEKDSCHLKTSFGAK